MPKYKFFICCIQLDWIKSSDAVCEYVRPQVESYSTLQFGSFDEIYVSRFQHSYCFSIQVQIRHHTLTVQYSTVHVIILQMQSARTCINTLLGSSSLFHTRTIRYISTMHDVVCTLLYVCEYDEYIIHLVNNLHTVCTNLYSKFGVLGFNSLQRNTLEFSKRLIEQWQQKGHMHHLLPHVSHRFEARRSSKTNESTECATSKEKTEHR